MGKECLVLSVGYEPMALIDWEHAMTLLCQDKVEIVEEYSDKKIRSSSREWAMPSVVRVMKYIARDRKAVKFSRENIYSRDRGQCQYCGTKVTRDGFEYEHVLPKCRGGKTIWENIVVACTSCNQKKGNKTPTEAKMRLLKVPVKPSRLPNDYMTFLEWRKGMPETWMNYLRSTMYWKDELVSDEGK